MRPGYEPTDSHFYIARQISKYMKFFLDADLKTT